MIQSWKAKSIPLSRWKKATMYHKVCGTPQEIRTLYEEAKKESLSRLRETVVWKKTLAYRKHKKPIRDIKKTYADAVLRFLRHPERSDSVQSQNSLVGGFSMRSSLVSMGMIPDTKGKISIHTTYT